MGPDNYCVYFHTEVRMHVRVDANSEEEAEELVSGFSPTVNWSDAVIADFGYEEIVVDGVTS